MIESLRLRWSPSGGYTAQAINPLLSDYGVDLDRKLMPRGSLIDSPAASLTADDSLSNSAFYRAIHVIASLVAQTPFEIKDVEKSENGVKKTPSTEHDGYFATTHQANPEETASECRYRVISNAVMHGAGYAAIRRDMDGGSWLYPFESPGTQKIRRDGKVWYVFDLYPGDEQKTSEERFRKFPSKDVIEVSAIKKKGLLAYCVWWLAKNALAEGIGGSTMRAARAKNGGRPSFVLSTDSNVEEKAAKRIQEDFSRIHSGWESVGIPPLLDRGLKATPLQYSPEFQAEEVLATIPQREIANFTGVPSVFLGDPAGISYESLEKMIEVLLRLGVSHWWYSWEDQIRAKLLTPEERRSGSMTAEFDRSAMVYMDGQTMGQLIRAWGGGTPVATANNIRGKLGWEPLDDPEADKLQMPKNIGKDGSNNTPTDGAKPSGGRPKVEVAEQPNTEQQNRIMANAWDDTVRRILKAGERAASNDKGFMAFCDSLDADADMRSLAWERSRGAGAVCDVVILEEHAAAGLRACKEKLLDVAGEATKGKLHEVFHSKYGPLMVALPEYAAKAVMEAVSCDSNKS